MRDLPPRGGDGRQPRGGRRRALHFERRRVRKPERLAGQRPPLPCRASPPRGGRSANCRTSRSSNPSFVVTTPRFRSGHYESPSKIGKRARGRASDFVCMWRGFPRPPAFLPSGRRPDFPLVGACHRLPSARVLRTISLNRATAARPTRHRRPRSMPGAHRASREGSAGIVREGWAEGKKVRRGLGGCCS